MSKIPVGILGATGMVGQRFIELLQDHPWFKITCVAASEKSAGKPYREAVNWLMRTRLSKEIGDLQVLSSLPNLPCKVIFSSLDASVAHDIELDFVKNGYTVITNTRNHRMHPLVPLLVPEVNAFHLALLEKQNLGSGKLVANPNCSTIGLTLALKPLHDLFGIEAVSVVTMQAISGAGYPGVASLDILDNVIPFINGEEKKMETEPLKILGNLNKHSIIPSDIKISAQCNRVAVSDGHLLNVAVKLKNKPSPKEMIDAFQSFTSDVQEQDLPLAPKKPIHYFDHDHRPQPKVDRDTDKGMAACIGRLRECALFDYKFVVLSHNTIRGAAGGAILNAELMLKKGLL